MYKKTFKEGCAFTENNKSDTTKRQDLIITRVFDAPIEEVWRAWSDPDYVMKWWGPDGLTHHLQRLIFAKAKYNLSV
ncbi:SRPBCC domain-containing protein [Bacillus sp. JJ722]|uniref:SRPBCC domain-containing protein n=1 Tax=Bacillus sp. JJ722 TaxID=3122973 RepID=UPI002FFDFE4B